MPLYTAEYSLTLGLSVQKQSSVFYHICHGSHICMGASLQSLELAAPYVNPWPATAAKHTQKTRPYGQSFLSFRSPRTYGPGYLLV